MEVGVPGMLDQRRDQLDQLNPQSAFLALTLSTMLGERELYGQAFARVPHHAPLVPVSPEMKTVNQERKP
jgi:hypothetical protein